MTVAHDKADEILALHTARLAESGQLAEMFRDSMHAAIDETLAALEPAPADPTLRGAGKVGKITKTEKGTNGVYRITTDSPITDVRFDCNLDLNTPFPDLRNCEVAGPVTWGTPRPLIKASHDSLIQARLSYCTIHAQALPASATDAVDGIMGRRYLLDHCDIYGVDDGAGMAPGPDGRLDVELIGTRIHHLLWRKRADSFHTSDGSHTDCLQIHNGGRGLRVIDSDLDGTALDARSDNGHPGHAMSLLMFSPWQNGKPLSDVLVARSRLRGKVGLNMAGWGSAERFGVLANQIDCTVPVLASNPALHPLLQVAGNLSSSGAPANTISRS